MAHNRFNVLTPSNITEPKFFIEKVKQVKKKFMKVGNLRAKEQNIYYK